MDYKIQPRGIPPCMRHCFPVCLRKSWDTFPITAEMVMPKPENKAQKGAFIMNLNYRKDIDGLRAISVLAVLLNHAGIALFSGGYIGVDVFFVISGYLITSIIAKEIQSNQFSLIRFYERRVRRILPALFVMVVFTFAACAILYDPEKFREFGKSVIATTLFSSNINFWMESGYFDAPSQLKPLLHTWSLAVEEQFYIIFPMFLFLVYRYARKFLRPILAGTAILSFSFAVYITFQDSSTAFYLAHLRAWELLVGGMLALNFVPADWGKKYSNLIGLAGLALIALPIFLYTESTTFPGLAALPPVLGAALILFSGTEGNSFVARFLGLPPLVFIGKISYSLYLWHWPCIILVKYYAIRSLTPLEMTAIILLTLMISTLSWRFVETPFRSKDLFSTRRVFTFAAGSMTLMLIMGWIVFYRQGFPQREGFKVLAKDDKKNTWLFQECNINSVDNIKAIIPCKVGKKSQTPSFMIVGDSHVPTYGKAIHYSAVRNDISGILTYANGCPTLLDMKRHPDIGGDVSCIEYPHMVLDYLKEHPEIHTVIIANRWTIWEKGELYKQEGGKRPYLTDALNEAPPNANEEYLFTLGMERTIKAIAQMGCSIVLVAPLPEIGYDVPSANFIASQTGRDVNQIIAPSLEEYWSRNQETFAIIETFEKKYGLQIIEPWKLLCMEGKCRVAIDGVSLYRDDDHLSIFGSEIIEPAFETFFESMEQASN
jgi:peptidoglycan/LPS O-acetylase OafA/YrhL